MKKTTAWLFSLSLMSFGAAAVEPPAVFDLQGAEAQAALSRNVARLQASPDDFEALKNAGILLHQMNRHDQPDKDRVAQGEAYLKKAAQLREGDAQVAAWLGSITTMKAIFENDPGKQMFYVKQGSRYMDGAVQKAPEDMVVRLTRAYNSLELPAFLQRTRFAVEDFKVYLDWCGRHACPAGQVAQARDKLKVAEKIVADNQ